MPDRAERTPIAVAPAMALTLVVSIGIGWGIWLRLVPIGGAFLFGDELHGLRTRDLSFVELASHFDVVGSGILLPIFQKAIVAVFGPNLWAIRAVALLPGLGLIALASWLARRGGVPGAGAGAALLVAGGSLFIFYSHFARSYSLATALAIGSVLVIDQAVNSAREWTAGGSRRRWLGLAAAGALLGGLAAYAHLTSALFVFSWALGLGVQTLARRGSNQVWAAMILAFGGAAGVALLLHLPAAESLLEFSRIKGGEQVYPGTFGPMDVLRVAAGSNGGAYLLVASVAASIWVEARERGWDALPMLASVMLPPLWVALISPYGDAYAYARYLLPSVLAALTLVAMGSCRWIVGMSKARSAAIAPIPTLALAILFAALGPHGYGAPSLNAFANSYLGLYPLPAFSRADSAAPSAYAVIASSPTPLRVVEFPPSANRSLHYLARVQQVHGHDVVYGTLGKNGPGGSGIESDLYVDLSRGDSIRAEFDVLVVHRNLLAEVDRYWEAVYAMEGDREDDALMERHRVFARDLPYVTRPAIAQLEAALGAPRFTGDEVVIWVGPGIDLDWPKGGEPKSQ